jgi:hypothetical protein
MHWPYWCVVLHVQALGISTAAAQRILDANAGGRPSFMPHGNLRQMLAQAPSLPVQFPKLIHRYPLLQNTHEVSSCWRLQCILQYYSMHNSLDVGVAMCVADMHMQPKTLP